jgi:hypothetical protein
MNNHKNLLAIVLFSLCASWNTIEAMKRRPEMSPHLLQAAEEAMQYDNWREDLMARIRKKAKFEAALAQVEAPKRILHKNLKHQATCTLC